MTVIGELHTRNGAPEKAQEKTAAQLAGDLAHQMTNLLHHEVDLLKVEMAAKGRKAGIGAGALGAAGAAGMIGAMCLTACAIAALALVLPVWAAALVVGAAYLVVAGGLALSGRSELRASGGPVPAESLESAKEDVQWIRTQARSAKR